MANGPPIVTGLVAFRQHAPVSAASPQVVAPRRRLGAWRDLGFSRHGFRSRLPHHECLIAPRPRAANLLPLCVARVLVADDAPPRVTAMARRAPRRPASSRFGAPSRSGVRSRRPETLEPRIVMSADPLLSLHGSISLIDDAPAMTTHNGAIYDNAFVESAPVYDPDADFWAGSDLLNDGQDELGRRIESTLYEANQQTGQDRVLATYGFTGVGQTVAVIDTGIAYSHYALGGGVGAGYRVVGGWDFTENDANFYDDQGPKSAHGTHVAGIVGADGNGLHSGVATGVDLVGLRVFDDAGNGYFSWTEQALVWVYNNRNSFANPITAVNLSLGTEWNSMSVPAWAMLEDDFARLESVGIFVSVSAGNSFTNYNTKGLSYPAASSHVVPVMATDPNGQLSYFSQRADIAIAAPGRYITSTVPDYAANDADTIDNDWLSMSGTSMAAPYVAGASVLVRQAMEFVGRTGIDQWDIYDHMMATADTFYDAVTATNFKRLNLWAAIDALMPEDDFGSSQIDAYNLGTINGSGATPLANLSGVISTLDDADCFKFVAGASGTVTVKALGTTHQLAPQWQAWGSGNWTVNNAGECVINVIAGQTYTFSLSTSEGLGYYDLSVNLESSFAAIEWGAIGPQETRTGLSVNGETWYRVVAGRTGYFTVEALTQSGAATVAIYNDQMSALTSAGGRADVQAVAGQTLYLRVAGTSPSLSLRMTNGLTVSAGVATLVGTAGDDTLSFTAGATTHTVGLNGVNYSIAAATVSQVTLNGAGGVDSATMTGDASKAETVSFQTNWTQISRPGFRAVATGVEHSSVAGQAADNAYLYDTAGSDTFDATPTSATLTGTGFSYSATGFGKAYAYATAGGDDTANLYDGATDDVFVGNKVFSSLRSQSSSFFIYVAGYENVNTFATGGSDIAYLYGHSGDDHFEARHDQATLEADGGSYTLSASNYERVMAFAGLGGSDQATFYDGLGADTFAATTKFAQLKANDGAFSNYASGFKSIQAYATLGGVDTASLYDGAGDDTLVATPSYASITGQGGAFVHRADGFERVNVFAKSGGYDTATLYDSSADDRLVANFLYAYMRDVAGTYLNYTAGFDLVRVLATAGGSDLAYLYDSAGNDTFVGGAATSYLQAASGQKNQASGFDNVFAYSLAGGVDDANFEDTNGNDTVYGRSDYAYHFSSGGYRYAKGFDTVRATGGAGTDVLNVSAVDYAFEQIGAWT